MVSALIDHLQEIVDVHTLVNVNKEFDGLAGLEVVQVHFVQLAGCLDVGLILCALNCGVNI